MPKVLIVSPTDPRPRLRETSLWRADVDRFLVPDGTDAFERARELIPDLVVLDGSDPVAAVALIERLRRDDVTRTASIAVLGPAAGSPEEQKLRKAGANLVLGDGTDAALWEARLEELLRVPRRRETRLPVRVSVWCRASMDDTPLRGLAINVSIRGLLLETIQTLALGSKLDLTFPLPDAGKDLHVVGQVVREAPPQGGRSRYGVEFLLPRLEVRERIQAFVEAQAH